MINCQISIAYQQLTKNIAFLPDKFGELIVLFGFSILISSIFGLVRIDRYENEERAKWREKLSNYY